MLEPDLYIFKVEGEEWSLDGQGPGKIEWQTPKEFLNSTPLDVLERVTWGQTKIIFARLQDEESKYYALIERIEDDGRPNPQWALVLIEPQHYNLFKEKFEEYCTT